MKYSDEDCTTPMIEYFLDNCSGRDRRSVRGTDAVGSRFACISRRGAGAGKSMNDPDEMDRSKDLYDHMMSVA